jgi:hypothetical protein
VAGAVAEPCSSTSIARVVVLRDSGVILLCKARRPVFVIADTLAGAAPFGEGLTVVVVGGEERQPVSNPLEPVRRPLRPKQPSPRTPDGLWRSAESFDPVLGSGRRQQW